MSSRLKYSKFADRIDVDAFEEAIDFEPVERTRDGEDRGHCLDLWGLHKSGDRTGKFSIHREKRVYNCWVCGGGTLLSLVMEIKGWDETKATDWLYQFSAPVEESNDDFLREITGLLAAKHREDAVLPYFNSNVLSRWHEEASKSRELAIYQTQRGISTEVIESYRVGYDPNHRRASSRGDYHGPAVIFPHIWKDKLVGWQERWLADDTPDWLPKYTNTNDFPRKDTIYGYEPVYFADQPIVVCESVPTVLMLVSLEIPAMATFGSSVTPEQLVLMRRCQQGLVLAPDNDSAGRKWKNAIVEALDRYTILYEIPPIGEFDSGADLGDLAGKVAVIQQLYEDRQTVL